MKRCYYQILEVDRKATPTEVKQSYRKLALKYHPDKNSEDDAKQRFVEINEAYNVLSDVNERTWYDNNREKILFNKEEMSKEDLEQYTFGFNIWTYFTANSFSGYQDNEGGFYSVYRDVFEKIKTEEAKAFNSREDVEEEFKKYEGFGDSKTSEDRMLKFYQDWENFVTYKTFTWIQEYDTRDGENRWVRREMQKENKKQRQTEKKNYVKTIKDLLAYVRKRDPRFREYLMKVKEEEDRKLQQKVQKQKLKKIEKEQMKVVKQKLEEQRFREIEQYYKKQNEQLAGQKVHQTNEKYVEQDDKEFYCEVCQKGFKSQNQLRNHEKSKQHKQMIKDIEKQVMLKEEMLRKAEYQPVEKQEENVDKNVGEQSPKKKNKKKKKKNQLAQNKESEDQQKEVQPEPVKPKVQQVKKQEVKVKPPPVQQDSDSDDEDQFMNTLLNNRNAKNQTKVDPKNQKEEEKPYNKQKQKQEKKKQAQKPVIKSDESSEQQGQEEQKLGKAKLKKQKKAEQQKAGKEKPNKCNVCNENFTSKTKLFEHINKSGHASTK